MKVAKQGYTNFVFHTSPSICWRENINSSDISLWHIFTDLGGGLAVLGDKINNLPVIKVDTIENWCLGANICFCISVPL